MQNGKGQGVYWDCNLVSGGKKAQIVFYNIAWGLKGRSDQTR